MNDEPDYGIAQRAGAKETTAPDLPYRPCDPQHYRPGIGLIGCGGISEQHLKAYHKAGYRVLALCDRGKDKAEARRREFFPAASICSDYRDVLDRPDIEVVDIATHPRQRETIIEQSLLAKKHVLSQKPFAVDLDFGQRMIELAAREQVRLAVNTNGRWAPHYSYIRAAISEGLIGEVVAMHCEIQWDHNWIAGTPFDSVHHIILYDFGIHWFDLVHCFSAGAKPVRVYASLARSKQQKAKPPLLGQAVIEFDGCQASLSFDGDARFGPQDCTTVVGDKGTIQSIGPDLMEQEVTLHRKDSYSRPNLQGTWFPDGFHGTMAELLCAIEEGREPSNGAASHLKSLELCFAAVASAEDHEPHAPGSVRRIYNQ